MDSGHSRAAFIARLTAGATHEVRNVLSIVKESAGLVEDLLTVAGPGGRPDEERIRQALSRIEDQVIRGADLLTSLNRVAHGVDRPEERVDLVAASEHAVRLCRRFARERRREVELGAGSTEASTVANALDVYRAVAEALDWSVERAPEHGTVRLEVEGGEPAILRFGLGGGEQTVGDLEHDLARLREALVDLPATVRHDASAGGFTLVFE